MRSKRALLFAIIFAAVAVLLVNFYIQKRIAFYTERFQKEAIVVAAKDILQSEKINDESYFELKMIPLPYIEPGAIKENLSARIGYVAAVPIKEGEQITEQKLLRPGEVMSSSIPKGKRAFTIAINDITGVAGKIRPGDKVDIIGLFKTVDERTKTADKAEAVTILQNITVFSVGRTYVLESMPRGSEEKAGPNANDVNFSNVTLLLSPRQAMDIALAQEIGTLALSLRPKFDTEPPEIIPELKENRSTPSSVTGIKEKMDISPGPKWLEQRGEKSLWVR